MDCGPSKSLASSDHDCLLVPVPVLWVYFDDLKVRKNLRLNKILKKPKGKEIG